MQTKGRCAALLRTCQLGNLITSQAKQELWGRRQTAAPSASAPLIHQPTASPTAAPKLCPSRSIASSARLPVPQSPRSAHVSRTVTRTPHARTRNPPHASSSPWPLTTRSSPGHQQQDGHQHGRRRRKARDTPNDGAPRPTQHPHRRRLDRELDGVQAAVRERRPETVRKGSPCVNALYLDLSLTLSIYPGPRSVTGRVQRPARRMYPHRPRFHVRSMLTSFVPCRNAPSPCVEISTVNSTT